MKPLAPDASTADIIESLQELFIRVEANPDRKGAIVLEWFIALPPEHRLMGHAIYGIAKERQMAGHTFNISGTVGNLNLGQQYDQVTAMITTLNSAGGEKSRVATAFKALAEGISGSELTDDQKSELLEGVSTLAEEAQAEKPKRFTVSAILKTLPAALSVSTGLAKLWSEHGQTVLEFFHHLV